ncbi:thiamine diphosphokinase [Clostridium hydrogenum]|uniref:thiamine diphosphokinase n=1 Tax=Clostridium hydrogenum TaxID=2855764 RepID=UPI001F17B145|nr:thiamine diphosphokinase [Clostridium hydrogenum]
MKAVIISGGTEPSYEVLHKELRNCDFLVCADSGANCIYKYKIKPNILIGDFDSASNEALEYYKKNCADIIKFPPEKDFTDTELALKEVLKLEVSEIVFLGCTGTRIDHLFGNIGLLNRCLDLEINAFIKDDNNEMFIINKESTLRGTRGTLFSIQAFGDEVKELSIIGAKYPLKDYNLKFGDPRTVSNEFLDEDVTISFKTGKVIVMKSKD